MTQTEYRFVAEKMRAYSRPPITRPVHLPLRPCEACWNGPGIARFWKGRAIRACDKCWNGREG